MEFYYLLLNIDWALFILGGHGHASYWWYEGYQNNWTLYSSEVFVKYSKPQECGGGGCGVVWRLIYFFLMISVMDQPCHWFRYKVRVVYEVERGKF